MAKAILEIGGAVFSLAGVAVGVYGTYLTTKFLHPYTATGFVKSMVRMMWRKATRQNEKNLRNQRVAAAIAIMSPENKAESYTGVHWLFVGFVFQTVGAIMILIDSICVNLHHGG